MRVKYIEERFQPYFIFGEYPDGIRVDIASSSNSTIATLSREQAETIIGERWEVLNMLSKLALKLDEVSPNDFDKIWYGHERVQSSL